MNGQPSVFDGLGALGDGTRSRILAALEGGELTVSELCRVLQLPQSTVSRHLGLLSSEGWLTSRAEGTRRHYRVSRSLPPATRQLWTLVHDELEASGHLDDDRERARSVVAERIDRSRAFFSRSAGRWDSLREELYGRSSESLALFGLLDPGWTVGDLGAGTCPFAALVAPLVARVVAVDRAPEMLEAGGQRVAGLPNVELREGELEALPLSDGELDLAVLSLVLHYVVDPPRVLTEAYRCLAPGGRLVVVDMRPHAREEYREEMGHAWLGFEPGELTEWLMEAGFSEPAVRPLHADTRASGPLLFVASARRGEGGRAPD